MMNISRVVKQSYSEIDEFLELLTEDERNEIPEKLRNFFKENKDKYYIKNIDPNIPIKDQDFKEETLAIIAFLNLKYWCKDEAEKKRLKAIYIENDRISRERADKGNKATVNIEKEEIEQIAVQKVEETSSLVPKEESALRKFINKILKFFKK